MKRITEAIALMSTVGVLFGGGLLIAYCTAIGFFPSGLTAADTLFFLWISIIAGVTWGVFVFNLWLIAVGLSAALDSLPKKLRYRNWWLEESERAGGFERLITVSVGNGVLFFLIAFFLTYPNSTLIVGTVSSVISIWFIIYYFRSMKLKALTETDKKLVRLLALSLPVIVFFLTLFITDSWRYLPTQTMEKMGIKQNNVSIVVDKTSYEMLQKVAGIAVECDKVCVLPNVNVLFSGIGSKMMLEIAEKTIVLDAKSIVGLASNE